MRHISHLRPISLSQGSKPLLGWLWVWRGVYAARAIRQSKLMPGLDRPDEDGQPLPMPASLFVLRMAVMAFVTTAKALPPMPVRAPPEGKRGAAGWAGAPADAPKVHAAAARPAGGETEALQSDMDAALDLCHLLPDEHLPKAAANMGLHLSMLASAAGLVLIIVKAKTGAQLAAMLSAHPLLFGAAATKAATQLANWRVYMKAKILTAGVAPGCVRLLEDLKALFARLPTDWGLHTASLAVLLSASVRTRQATLEAASKRMFSRSVVSAMVDSTAPEADAAHVKAVQEPVPGFASSVPTWCQAFLDSPVATTKTPQVPAPPRVPDQPLTPAEYPVFPPLAPVLRVHLSNAHGADYEDVQRALKLVFGDSVDVGPEVVSKGFWYLDVREPAWQQLAHGQAKATVKTPPGRWLMVQPHNRDGTP